MPDEGEQDPSQADDPSHSQDPASEETRQLRPDLTKRVPVDPRPATPTPPAPLVPPGQTYAQQPSAGQPYTQQPYTQQPYAQQPYAQQPYAQQPYPGQPYAPQQQPQQPYPGQPYGQTTGGQPYGAPGAYGQVYAQPGAYRPAGPTTSGKATAVLVLGIASLILVWMCGIGLVTAIVALVMAPGATREIQASQGRLGGVGMVQGGKICSWVTVGLVGLGVGLYVLLMVLRASVANDFS